jgi:hypothetical protein
MQGGKIKKNRRNLLVLENKRVTNEKKNREEKTIYSMPFWHEIYSSAAILRGENP